MEDKQMLQESLMKMKSLMNFTPGMTATENKVVIEENKLEDPIDSNVNAVPGEASDIKELEDPIGSEVNNIPEPSDSDVKEEEVAEEVKECDDMKEEEVAEEDDMKKEEPKEGATNMAIGFMNESAPSNKEMKRKNKQDRLDKKLGRV